MCRTGEGMTSPGWTCSDLPEISGRVIHGEGRGCGLGFPTANIAPSAHDIVPPDGVYCALVRIAGHAAEYGATASIGNNPTFADVIERRIEVYLHDFNRSIYGRQITLRLIQHLRPMQCFAGVDELIAQTARDVATSRAILAKLGLN